MVVCFYLLTFFVAVCAWWNLPYSLLSSFPLTLRKKKRARLLGLLSFRFNCLIVSPIVPLILKIRLGLLSSDVYRFACGVVIMPVCYGLTINGWPVALV